MPWSLTLFSRPYLVGNSWILGIYNQANTSLEQYNVTLRRGAIDQGVMVVVLCGPCLGFPYSFMQSCCRARWTLEANKPLCPLDCFGRGLCQSAPLNLMSGLSFYCKCNKGGRVMYFFTESVTVCNMLIWRIVPTICPGFAGVLCQADTAVDAAILPNQPFNPSPVLALPGQLTYYPLQ